MAEDLATIGAFAGARAAEADQFQNKLSTMSVGLMGAQTTHAEASARAEDADTALKQLSLQQQSFFMDLQKKRAAQQPGQPKQPLPKSQDGGIPGLIPDDAIGTLEQQAYDYAQAGMTKESDAALRASSQARRDNALIRKDYITEQRQTQAAHMKEVSVVARLLEGVGDESGWQSANQQYQMITGKKSPFAGLPFNKQLVDAVKKEAMTAFQEAELKARKDSVDARARSTNERKREFDISHSTSYLEKKAKIQQEARTSKSDAKLAPPQAEVKAALDTIEGRFRSIDTDSSEARDMARDLVDRAKTLMRNNPALSGSEARTRAMVAQEKEGVFNGIKARSAGGVADKALPLPDVKGLTREQARAKLQPNKWYTDGKKPQFWDGDNMLPSDPASNVKGAMSDGNDAEDDDDEDDD